MLYYLFDYLDSFNFPGAGLFQFISFRAAMALITSLIVSIFGAVGRESSTASEPANGST